MKTLATAALVLILSFGFSACNTVGDVLPPNDQVLVYQLPYDLTYLRTMEALDAVDGWQLETTDKEKGLIAVGNTQYSHMNDSDKRVVTFAVKRVDLGHTSVSIVPESQRVFGGSKLLDAVAGTLGREVRS